MLTGQLAGGRVDARWDTEAGLVTDDATLERVTTLGRMGTVVAASPVGPFWPAGSADPDQAYFTVTEAWDEVTDGVGGPPGWPWGVPEGATDR
jgi:hypothetical protein